MQSVKIDAIVVRNRKRPLRDIETLKQSIRHLGLLNPITINRNNVLIAGYHRLEACKALGWSEIPAEIVKYSDIQAELAEIDENIIRNKLTALEMAEQLQRRKEIYETLYPDTKKATIVCNNLLQHSPMSTQSTLGKPVTFVNDTVAKTGKHRSTIYYYLHIAKQLPEDISKVIKGTAVEDNYKDLLTLCKINTHERQLELINKVKNGEAISVRAAICKETREKNKNLMPDLNKDFVPTKAYRVLLQRHNKLELEYYRLLQEHEAFLNNKDSSV